MFTFLVLYSVNNAEYMGAPPHLIEMSLARFAFDERCEAALNEHINAEYTASYVYHSMWAFFDRDDVGLPNIAKFFKEQSEEEREHAEEFMKYLNKRGGRVKLLPIAAPEFEFQNSDKGEALFAFETALNMEKQVTKKLQDLHGVADECNDAQMTDFIEGFLEEQVESIKKMAILVSQLKRVGQGLGVYQFDKTFSS
eukprot:GILI01001712.1.p1 GENE.GILI01001712.1~~GILI01001712.1.p1  ORF type:complete len:197 (+),score=79.48 GILI01001712.1:19-609(+)